MDCTCDARGPITRIEGSGIDETATVFLGYDVRGRLKSERRVLTHFHDRIDLAVFVPLA